MNHWLHEQKPSPPWKPFNISGPADPKAMQFAVQLLKEPSSIPNQVPQNQSGREYRKPTLLRWAEDPAASSTQGGEWSSAVALRILLGLLLNTCKIKSK